MLLQVSAGWRHGDGLDEQVKSHPLLKAYKALSEKVHAGALTAAELSPAAHFIHTRLDGKNTFTGR